VVRKQTGWLELDDLGLDLVPQAYGAASRRTPDIARGAGSLLFGLKPYDPLTLGTSVGLLVLIGGFAAFRPASRASKLDPSEALRCD
jgi:ABC-type antimicrobial peptide transport system permease subunit